MIRVAIQFLEKGELQEIKKTLPWVPNPGHKLKTKDKTYKVLDVTHNIETHIVTIEAEEVN